MATDPIEVRLRLLDAKLMSPSNRVVPRVVVKQRISELVKEIVDTIQEADHDPQILALMLDKFFEASNLADAAVLARGTTK